MKTKKYEVLWTRRAKAMLASISDKRVQSKIFERALQLEVSPELQGKPLLGELAGYRSVRAVGQRYRIIYRLEEKKVVVYIVAVGIRKEDDRSDVYELARKIIRSKLL